VLKALAAPLAVLVLALAGCGGDDDDGGGADSKAPEARGSVGGCETLNPPPQRPDGGAERPTEKLDPNGRYTVTMETNCGDFSFTLDQKTSPNTAASVAALVEDGFYDDTMFHRIAPGFVIQGGDPTATGAGGAGYDTRDVPPRNTKYVKGVVAMAKGAQDPRGGASSQFFVVTGETIDLPPDYAVLGEITEGQDVVDRIGKLGNATEAPTRVVVVEKATLSGP
jgi:peptidyl-prolyl cis-trans isomerase B (cyclophilin B)